MPMTFAEAQAKFAAHSPVLAASGIHLPGVKAYIPDGWGGNLALAMDAQPAAITSNNAGIPAFLTTLVDPEVFNILLAPNKGAEILGEVKKGTWVDTTAIFPLVELDGETTAYGDFNENGRAGANTDWPQRQAFLFQVIKEYGELEIERAGAGRINWVAQIDKAAATVLAKFSNYTYHYGVAGLQNYGLLNEPNLTAALTPATKTAGGTRWITAGGAINATANEVFADIQALFIQLVAQTAGLVEATDPLKLVLSPSSAVGLTATNSYNVSVGDLLKKNFPALTVVTDPLYGVKSTANPQGVAAGNLVQLIAPNVEGQESGYCAFNEKMRAHPIVRGTSSFKQKVTGGTWGAVIRQPFAISQMIGI